MSFDTMTLEGRWKAVKSNRSFPGKRIEIVDPDDERFRNVYEDLDQELPMDERKALLTLFPEYSKASSKGDDDTGFTTMTHKEAVADIEKMLDQGYVLRSIEKDRIHV